MLLSIIVKVVLVVGFGLLITYLWWRLSGRKVSFESMLDKHGQKIGGLSSFIFIIVMIYLLKACD
jgi:hypothetical protein